MIVTLGTLNGLRHEQAGDRGDNALGLRSAFCIVHINERCRDVLRLHLGILLSRQLVVLVTRQVTFRGYQVGHDRVPTAACIEAFRQPGPEFVMGDTAVGTCRLGDQQFMPVNSEMPAKLI